MESESGCRPGGRTWVISQLGHSTHCEYENQIWVQARWGLAVVPVMKAGMVVGMSDRVTVSAVECRSCQAGPSAEQHKRDLVLGADLLGELRELSWASFSSRCLRVWMHKVDFVK